jgi:hypothetical protein
MGGQYVQEKMGALPGCSLPRPMCERFRNRSQTQSFLDARKYHDHWDTDHFFEYAEDLDLA